MTTQIDRSGMYVYNSWAGYCVRQQKMTAKGNTSGISVSKARAGYYKAT